MRQRNLESAEMLLNTMLAMGTFSESELLGAYTAEVSARAGADAAAQRRDERFVSDRLVAVCSRRRNGRALVAC